MAHAGPAWHAGLSPQHRGVKVPVDSADLPVTPLFERWSRRPSVQSISAPALQPT